MNGQERVDEEPRIELRVLRETDAGALFDLMKKNLDVIEKSEASDEKVDLTLEFIENMFKRDPEIVRTGIFREERLVGHINLMPETEDTAAIAYLVDKDFARKGVASTAMKQFLQTVPDTYRVLTAYVLPHNVASREFLGKMGFKQKEVLSNGNVAYEYDRSAR